MKREQPLFGPATDRGGHSMSIQASPEMAKMICVNPDHVEGVTVTDLPDDKLAVIEQVTIPSFCYDNSALALNLLNADVVYGVAMVNCGGTWLPIEHCWLKLADGDYVDPTYQVLAKLNERKYEVIYYKLFEITSDLMSEMKQAYGELSRFVGVEMMWFRRSTAYRQYFLG